MNFILKIVEGPNRGAEIALVEGVAVTLGKGDDCDIVLADPTMPDAPLKVEAAADGVSVDGEPFEPLAVKTFGATSLAVGPADAPWGALKWPKAEPENPERPDIPEKPEKPDDTEKPAAPAGRKRGGCLGCLLALLALLLVLVGLGWLFRDRIMESDRLAQFESVGRGWYSRFMSESRDARLSNEPKAESLSDIARKYGLSLSESNGVVRMSGNLRTRAERLRATAEAYQSQPGVNLDLSDDESFRASADDALFTLTEGALKVVAATNRVVSISGTSPSPLSLKKTLEALDADLRKLRDVDVSGVRFAAASGGTSDSGESGYSGDSGIFAKRQTARRRKSSPLEFPVCGILTTPYPCLVMRDGRRIMEGAAMGGSVIVEIGADSVTLTNATGRFTWKP